MNNTNNTRIHRIATSVAILILAVAGTACDVDTTQVETLDRPASTTTVPAPCPTVELPAYADADYVGATPESFPGAWIGWDGEVIGFALIEDEPIYSDPMCALTSGAANLNTAPECVEVDADIAYEQGGGDYVGGQFPHSAGRVMIGSVVVGYSAFEDSPAFTTEVCALLNS